MACGSLLLRRLSLVAVSGGYSLVVVHQLLIVVASLVCFRARALGNVGFSSCGTWAQELGLPGPKAQAQQLWHMRLAAL